MVHTQWSGDSERAAQIHRGRRFMVYRVSGGRDASVVVKTPRPDRAASDAERLRHEYRILRNLPVHGVCQPLALEEQDDHPALLLEDAGPIDLDHWLGSRPTDLRIFYSLALQLADTLARIHANDIVHCDVTPSNVVVDPERATATLVDFDRATELPVPPGAGDTIVSDEASIPYLAPEQLGGIERRVDHRADLYALGAMFYRMLTGGPPALARDESPTPVVPPSVVNPAVPRPIEAIIARLLAAPPEERYPRAEAVIDDLRRAERSLHRSDRRADGHAHNPGPAAENEKLRAALARARSGHRAACVISGPPEAGKTTLATSLRSEVEATGGRFLLASCRADARTRSPLFAAFADGLRAILREPEEDRAVVQRRLRGASDSRVGWLASQIPELAELLGIERPRGRADALPEGDICLALCDLVSAMTPPTAALALVVDDLHEADGVTLRLLKGLIFAPAARRWLVVGVVRTSTVTPHSLLADTISVMRSADPSFAWIELERPSADGAGAAVAGLRAELETCFRRERVSRWLADATARILEAPNRDETLERVAGAFVPELADLCVVDLIDEDGGLNRAAAVDVDPVKKPILDALSSYETGWTAPRLLVPARDLEDQVVLPSVSEERIQQLAVNSEHADLLRELALASVLALPLRVGGQCIGCIHLARRAGRESFGAAERAVGAELAERAGPAIDRARRQEAMQQAIQLRDEFLSIAAHELSTPVTSLKLGIEGIRSGTIPNTPENLARAFRIAERQVGRLAQLIGDLLSVSRIQAGTVELALERVDLVEVVKAVIERFEEEAARTGSTISVHAPASVEGEWDRTRVDQVVTNLVSNAIKFGRGQPIEVIVDSQLDRARIAVRDRGIGIAADKVTSVFERFVRGVSSRQYSGLGLGLYIVTQIVEALGGTLNVTSSPGQGSTFVVELPRRKGSRDADGAA